MRQFFLFVIPACLFLAGCAANVPPPTFLNIEPAINSYQDPGFSASKYKTFSIFASSAVTTHSQLNGILEKQMLYQLRNTFELRGYKFVSLDQSPDFVVTLDGNSPYRETYVPPSQITVPYWSPGETITTYENSSGNFSYNTFGDYSSYGWGNYYGTTTSTTTTPGHLETQTYTTPGYMAGSYYPSITVSAFDSKTSANVWTGIAVGCSPQSDIRLSAQTLLLGLAAKFPECPYATEDLKQLKSYVGLSFFIYTLDGNDYFPLITNVKPSSPASDTEIQDWDMIIAIDGLSLSNKTFLEVTKLLDDAEPGTRITLTLWRVNKALTVSLTRGAREQSPQ